MKQTPDKNVLTFIQEFKATTGKTETEQNILVNLFTKRYCYYFANMLQTAFLRGELYWDSQKDHIVWLDTTGHYYDINGIYQPSQTAMIPISYIGNSILDFKHVPGQAYNATEQEIASWILNYQKGKHE